MLRRTICVVVAPFDLDAVILCLTYICYFDVVRDIGGLKTLLSRLVINAFRTLAYILIARSELFFLF